MMKLIIVFLICISLFETVYVSASYLTERVIDKCPACKSGFYTTECLHCSNMTIDECNVIFQNGTECYIKQQYMQNSMKCNGVYGRTTCWGCLRVCSIACPGGANPYCSACFGNCCNCGSADACCAPGQYVLCTCKNNGQNLARCWCN